MARTPGYASLLLTAILGCATGALLGAHERAENPSGLLDQMRTRAEETKVRWAKSEAAVDFVAKPVFRYDDQPRKFLDATMWVWTSQGRPVAFQKIEAMIDYRDKPLWGYCFASLASEPLSVTWNSTAFQTTEEGLELKPLLKAAPPAERPVERRRQLRDLAKQFAARIWDASNVNDSSEMRLLTTPIFEYSDPETKLPLGAVFGFASHGTNPDLLLVLESVESKGKHAWNAGAVRMTNGGLKVSFQDQQVWQVEPVQSQTGRFATWMFFSVPRQPAE